MGLRSEKCRDEHGVWDIGGGGLHFGEQLEDAAKRELMEEYSVEPLEMSYMGFREVHREDRGQDKTHWIAFDYKILVDPNKVQNGEPDKHLEVRWFDVHKLPKLTHSQLPYFLKKYRDKLF